MSKATTKIISTSRPVKTSCKNTKVRTAAGACAPERKPMMKSGGTSPFGILSVIAGIDKNPKPTAADRIAGAKMGTKKMAVGGMTESCGPGKPKGCGYAKAQRKNNRSRAMSKVGPVVGKVLGTVATIGALGLGAMKGKKLLDKQALENKKSGGTTHPGFKAVQSKIAAKQGISKEAAGAILASSARKASAKAKAANPRLKKVK
jgi:hypothetical protein